MSTIALRAWGPALSLGVASFVFVTAEVLPVGLLSMIAQSLGASEARIGLLLTVYAIAVTMLGLPLVMFTSRFDRKKLLLAVCGLFICGNVFSAMASSFTSLLLSRICVAMAHAVFWAIVPPLSIRVAPDGGQSRAFSFTVTGTSLAMVLGVPIGTLLGDSFGWRMAFGVVAVVAFILLVSIRAVFPAEPSESAGGLHKVASLAKNRNLLQLYALTILMAGGHFAAFTYFAPFMHDLGGVNAATVATLLLIFGLASILGSVVGGKLATKSGNALLAVSLLLWCALFVLFPWAVKFGLPVICLVIVLWGGLFVIISMVLQLRVVLSTPGTADQSTAIFSGSYNLGVGIGSLAGGLMFSLLGVGGTPYAGAVFLLAAAAIAVLPLGGKTKLTSSGKTGNSSR